MTLCLGNNLGATQKSQWKTKPLYFKSQNAREKQTAD